MFGEQSLKHIRHLVTMEILIQCSKFRFHEPNNDDDDDDDDDNHKHHQDFSKRGIDHSIRKKKCVVTRVHRSNIGQNPYDSISVSSVDSFSFIPILSDKRSSDVCNR